MKNNSELKAGSEVPLQGQSVRPRATTVLDGAKYVGMSRATLYAEVKAGNLKFVKIGGATRVEYDELDRWFNARSQEVAA